MGCASNLSAAGVALGRPSSCMFIMVFICIRDTASVRCRQLTMHGLMPDADPSTDGFDRASGSGPVSGRFHL